MLFNFKRSNLNAVLFVFAGVLVLIALIIYSVLSQSSNDALIKVTIGQTSILVEEAITPQEKVLGLGGREYLAQDHGMLFRFATPEKSTFWMKNMRFALDFIWINNEKVVDLSENVAAPGAATTDDQLSLINPNFEANAVVEVNAGFVKRNQIVIGDIVKGL